MTIETREPQTKQEWQRYYDLRWRILRAPWQPQGPDKDATDDTSIHRIVIRSDDVVLAVGRLHQADDTTAQLRFMAVESDQQGCGYGSLLLQSLEQITSSMHLKNVMLQAREGAVPFYQHHGYKVMEKTFLLFDEIQHYMMIKTLPV